MAETRIREALELLDGGRRWAKRPSGAIDLSHLRPKDRICVGMAMNAVGAPQADCNVVKALGRELWPDRCWSINGLVPSLNDHPDTTWADIEVWMEKAAVMREEACE